MLHFILKKEKSRVSVLWWCVSVARNISLSLRILTRQNWNGHLVGDSDTKTEK